MCLAGGPPALMRPVFPSTIAVGPRASRDVLAFRTVDDLRVVAIGGGTGLPIVLEGLKNAMLAAPGPVRSDQVRDRLVAIVTVADDGGSSGRLRQAYGVLPPGDIRNCLLALADRTSTIAELFDYRFEGDDEVSGHSLGNLILTALSRLENNFSRAIERGSEILNVRGRVFPSTIDDVRLLAQFDDGRWVEGESRIASVPGVIRRVSLEPHDPRALGEAVEAALYADVVVLGPGSLYTSVIPVLLVKELAYAIGKSQARVVLVMNLTTEPGETDHHTAADHLLAIRRHAPDVPIHDVLLNATPIPEELVRMYSAAGSTPVRPDLELLRALGYRAVICDLLGAGVKIRHDAHKLANAILQVAACTWQSKGPEPCPSS
jgi:uncharacterized cofD-like protein